MRIEQVTAAGFGPIVDASLTLVPGLTVVVGGNESAKSSWHAATYAALGGIRRGRGQPLDRDKEFARRRRPWDGGPWRVGARLALDDGRTIEMSHELESRVDCRAVDLVLGRDVSAEIMNEGTVDATMWLGLGRRAFEATACIRQAELLRVRDAGRELGDLIGRAAATGGADESAAAALDRLATFQRENVGTDRMTAVKPWRQAIDAESAARRAVDDARAARHAFDELAERVETLRRRADDLARQERVARAARRRVDAADLARRAARAEGLAAELGPRRSMDVATDQEAVGTVAAALATWRARPPVPDAGEDPAELRRLLDALPPDPVHDTAVAPAVAAARGAYATAARALSTHDQRIESTAVELPAGPSPEELRDLAALLAALGPEPRSGPDATGGRRRSRWPLGLTGLGVVAVVVGVVASVPIVSLIGAVAAVVGAVALVLGRRPPAPSTAGSLAAWRERRSGLAARADLLAVEPDAAAVRSAADAAAAQRAEFEGHRRWSADRIELERQVDAARVELRSALAGRGAGDDDAVDLDVDVEAAYAAYEARCGTAQETAALAAARPGLAARLVRAEQDAALRDSAARTAAEAGAQLRVVATTIGLVGRTRWLGASTRTWPASWRDGSPRRARRRDGRGSSRTAGASSIDSWAPVTSTGCPLGPPRRRPRPCARRGSRRVGGRRGADAHRRRPGRHRGAGTDGGAGGGDGGGSPAGARREPARPLDPGRGARRRGPRA